MPFAAPMMKDDENDPNKKDQSGVNISGDTDSVASNVPGQNAGAPASGSAQKSSGQYANIQSYLDANTEQADDMGKKISDNVNAKATDATSKIQGLDSKTPTVGAYDPNAVLGNVTNASDDDKAQYKTIKQTGGYTGPATIDGLEGYGDIQKAANAAASDLKNAGSEVGQQQLLKDNYGRAQYSAGENKLDQVLLQNSAGSKANLEGLSQKYSGLDKLFSDTSTKVGGAINQANTQALANKQAFNPAETAARTALMNPIQARADQMNRENPEMINRITSDAGDNILSGETMQLLGLNEGQDLYDINLASYLNPNLTQVGINNVASADERSKYAALSSLFDDPTMNQIDANGKAINPLSFNSSKFQSDLAGKSKEQSDYITNTRGLVNTGPYVNMKDMTIPEVQSQVDQLISRAVARGFTPEQAKADPSIANLQASVDAAKKKITGTNKKIVKG